MILFGHEGPVLGAAWLGYRVLKKDGLYGLSGPAARFFQKGFDFRFALIGAMLPDLIDKPLGLLLLKDQLSYGRIYAHTLLFFLLLLIPGLWFYRKKGRSWLLVLALGSFGHLILDDIWNAPVTLFWPLLGWQFPKIDLDLMGLAVYIWDIALRNPRIFFVEVVGFCLCLGFLLDLLKRKKLRLFILKGAIE